MILRLSFGRILIKHPRAIFGIFLVLTLLSAGGYLLIEVESNTIKMFSKRLPVRQAFDYVDSHMGGSMSVEIMADTGKKDGVKDPAFLRQLESLQDYINKHPFSMKTLSVLDLLKKMNQALHEKSEYKRDQDFRIRYNRFCKRTPRPVN